MKGDDISFILFARLIFVFFVLISAGRLLDVQAGEFVMNAVGADPGIFDALVEYADGDAEEFGCKLPEFGLRYVGVFVVGHLDRDLEGVLLVDFLSGFYNYSLARNLQYLVDHFFFLLAHEYLPHLIFV